MCGDVEGGGGRGVGFQGCGLTSDAESWPHGRTKPKAYEHYREASQRFEYFILGVSGALCAYIAQTLPPHKLDFSSYSITILSLLLIVASIVLGFKRIERVIFLHQANHEILHLTELRAGLAKIPSGEPSIDLLSFKKYDANSARRQIEAYNDQINHWSAQVEKVQPSILKLYKLRNYLLASGFIGLLLAKILAPYYP